MAGSLALLINQFYEPLFFGNFGVFDCGRLCPALVLLFQLFRPMPKWDEKDEHNSSTTWPRKARRLRYTRTALSTKTVEAVVLLPSSARPQPYEDALGMRAHAGEDGGRDAGVAGGAPQSGGGRSRPCLDMGTSITVPHPSTTFGVVVHGGQRSIAGGSHE